MAAQLGLAAPTADDERDRLEEARAFDDQAYSWLRENTRDTEAFKLLFNENISYGYYRNLLGLEPIGILLNLLSIAAAAAIVHYQPDFASLSNGKLVALGGLAAIHLGYFDTGLKPDSRLLAPNQTFLKPSRASVPCASRPWLALANFLRIPLDCCHKPRIGGGANAEALVFLTPA